MALGGGIFGFFTVTFAWLGYGLNGPGFHLYGRFLLRGWMNGRTADNTASLIHV